MVATSPKRSTNHIGVSERGLTIGLWARGSAVCCIASASATTQSKSSGGPGGGRRSAGSTSWSALS
eukprot:404047-Prymnesium_polylepis.2